MTAKLVRELFLGTVILTVNMSDFHTVISGDLFLALQRNSYIPVVEI